MLRIVGLREFRENISYYEKMVREGESFLVVRKSRPIFKILDPYSETKDLPKLTKRAVVDIHEAEGENKPAPVKKKRPILGRLFRV